MNGKLNRIAEQEKILYEEFLSKTKKCPENINSNPGVDLDYLNKKSKKNSLINEDSDNSETRNNKESNDFNDEYNKLKKKKGNMLNKF